MKSFFKNNLSLLFNIGMLVLLFTYPISDITDASKEENNDKLGKIYLLNNNSDQKHLEVRDKNIFFNSILLKADASFQSSHPILPK